MKTTRQWVVQNSQLDWLEWGLFPVPDALPQLAEKYFSRTASSIPAPAYIKHGQTLLADSSP
jgi:hypothetical protein